MHRTLSGGFSCSKCSLTLKRQLLAGEQIEASVFGDFVLGQNMQWKTWNVHIERDKFWQNIKIESVAVDIWSLFLQNIQWQTQIWTKLLKCQQRKTPKVLLYGRIQQYTVLHNIHDVFNIMQPFHNLNPEAVEYKILGFWPKNYEMETT